jgi:hypothetical protein
MADALQGVADLNTAYCLDRTHEAAADASSTTGSVPVAALIYLAVYNRSPASAARRAAGDPRRLAATVLTASAAVAAVAASLAVATPRY